MLTSPPTHRGLGQGC